MPHRRAMLAVLAALTLVLAILAPSSSAQDDPEPAPPPLVGITPFPAYGDFPDVAYVEMQWANSPITSCSGTLVAPTWVLTAAHCVQSNPAPGDDIHALVVTVFLGATNILDELDGTPNPGTEVHTADGWILHGDYDPATFANDVALIKLPTASAITPRAIATQASLVSAGDGSPLPAETFGFGQFCQFAPCTMNGTGSDFKLRMGTTLIYSDDDTEAFLGFGFDSLLRETTVFTIPDITVHGALCFGDSGGPMMVWENGVRVIGAVNSHIFTGTFGSCNPLSGSEYANGLADVVTSNLASWVAQVIDPPTKACWGQPVEIEGTSFPDKIIGTSSTDVFHGREGADFLLGRGSADYLCGGKAGDEIQGGSGRDSIKGHSGKDDIFGGSAKDTIEGGSAGDTIFGGTGADTIEGGTGHDNIAGEGGADNIRGNGGNDLLSGGSKGDTIRGGKGNDSIDGASGRDELHGNSGDDTIFGGSASDIITGGTGTDSCSGGTGVDDVSGCE